jgi:hypothetical protein
MKFICPLCGSVLSETHYHKVVKIQEKEKKDQKGELEKIKKQAAAANAAVAAAKKREKEAKNKAKQDVENASKQGALSEKRRSERLMQGQAAKLRKAHERIKMLERGTTPQSIGLADEPVLVERLKREFPDDRIEHAGKGGDVLHFAVYNREDTGCIVYECKHTDRIQTDHIQQTAMAKRTRQATYGILVTTGTRKGFSGLDRESDVFIVAQAGVLTLARICRDSLVTMAKQRLDAAAKEAAAKRLMDYVTSPICKTPLEEAISHTIRAHKNLVKEIKQHMGDWKERHEVYQTIHHDVSHVQKNIDRVLEGEDPLKLEKPRLEPLALPIPSN